MKKKLEAELISIAHRILKLKNKSEIDQLLLETQRLYEKLSVLKFVEENFANIQPTIGKAQAQEILETAFDESPAETKTGEPEIEPAPVADVQPEKKDKPKVDEPELMEEVPNPAAEQDVQNVEKPEKVEDEVIADVDSGSEPAKQNELGDSDSHRDETVEPDAAGNEENKEDAPTDEPEAVSEAPVGEAASSEQDEPEATEGPVAEEASAKTDEHAPETPVLEQSINFEEPETKEEVAAAISETIEIKQEDLFKPTFEWAFEPKAEDKESTPEPKEEPRAQVAFEDLLGKGYVDPVFVKPEEIQKEKVSYTADELPNQDAIPISRIADKIPVFKMNNNEFADKTISLNDRLSKGITVGLNDRIAFVKNLFNNSNEDYNRVLSQLITFDTFQDAQYFIDNMVKPDYNNWDGKDEYAQRFMEVVEKKFS